MLRHSRTKVLGTRHTIWALAFAVLLAPVGTAAIESDVTEPDGTKTSGTVGPAPELYDNTVARGIAYLRQSQLDNGSFSSHAGPAITSLVATALLEHGRTVDDPMVARALAYIEGFVQTDGGIYPEGSFHQNYETCVTLVCFKAANADGRYDGRLAAGERYIKGLQWDEGEDNGPQHVNYGGAGYGSHQRPDLSNTTVLIDTLKSLGRGADDPAIQKSLIFVSRSQNLESEHNATEFAHKNPDGGFYYTPAAGGTSQAGLTESGGLRSYGSMTYAGLKSMIHAGVDSTDPRVLAATNWIRANYTLAQNPGMGDAGLYYYYHTFAKALDAVGADHIRDTGGKEHDWRQELTAMLAELQQDSGAWTNGNPRWLEGDGDLVTAYSLLALDYCRPVKE